MSSKVRVLVKIHRKNDHASPKVAPFTECILRYFGLTNGSGDLYVELKDNCLVISDFKQPGNERVHVKHPVFCPILHMNPTVASSLPEEISMRGIDVGVSVVLESCDGKFLLSRRAPHLRIFPGLWVPPGGHIEENETLLEAGLRELKEETGLDLKPFDFIGQKIDMLALWESVYPPKVSVRLPARHHIVVYFHAKLIEDLTADAMENRISFDPEEVDACAWLDRDLISAIAHSFDEKCESVKTDQIPDVFRILSLDCNKQQKVSYHPTKVLTSILSDDACDKERVSTGTKYALKMLLQLQYHLL